MLWLLGLCVWLLIGTAIAACFSLNEDHEREEQYVHSIDKS